MCFILSAITAVRHLGAIAGQWGTENTFSSAPSIMRGGERHMRGHLRGGPAVARLGPLLRLPDWSGRLLRCWSQGDLGPGCLALREVVASYLAWAPSISPTLRRSGLRGGWRWFDCLLSRHRFGATGSRRRAGAFRGKVSHRLRRLMSLCEVSSKALLSWSNRLPDETGASRKGTKSASFISAIVSQRWRSITTWAVAMVARRARSVALLILREAASRPTSSLASILPWKT